ncbi:hypothetical protein [Photobacterium leiognathi]|uniref:hypothetical protein n=1 Tax=Photobacterium leiognathi TaxID=553611 RepID=UPI002734A867|nr:hypothetical protein [Photobacterium leiognathi]
MESPCAIVSCGNSIVQDLGECSLHCTKNDYGTDFHNNSVLSMFYDQLVDYILKQVYEISLSRPILSRDDFKAYLLDELESETAEALAREQVIVFDHIYFPERDSRDRFDYFKVLKKVKRCAF